MEVSVTRQQEEMWTCCDDAVYDRPGICDHLRSVHGLTELGGESRMMMRLDEPGWRVHTYAVTCHGVELICSVKTWEEPAKGNVDTLLESFGVESVEELWK